MTARVGVVGATGYVGSEVVRWLLGRDDIEVVTVTARANVGRPLSDAVPSLLGCTDLSLEAVDVAALAKLDAVVLAVSHGAAHALAAALDAAGAPRILDCSRDHRHAPGWVYGQADWASEQLSSARRIAVPGCFATAIALAIAPFAAARAITGPVKVVAATGSTGSGRDPSAATHHPDRFVNLKAYKVLKHQHVPEIEAFLATVGQRAPVRFVPLSAPVDRGILATCFVPTLADGVALVADAYAARPLIRLRADTPELRHVRGTAFADLAVHPDDDGAVVISAVDNLGKGAAAQAVQCLNLSLGLPVDAGLARAPATP